MAVTPPLALRKPMDVRESPILAIVHLFSLITAHVNVVPENSVSIDASTILILHNHEKIKQEKNQTIIQIYIYI